MPKNGRNVVMIDSKIDWERKLKYMGAQSAWAVYRSIYWGLYIFVLGFMLLLMNAGILALGALVGWAVILLAVFIIVYGAVLSLHLKFMKKHGA